MPSATLTRGSQSSSRRALSVHTVTVVDPALRLGLGLRIKKAVLRRIGVSLVDVLEGRSPEEHRLRPHVDEAPAAALPRGVEHALGAPDVEGGAGR